MVTRVQTDRSLHRPSNASVLLSELAHLHRTLTRIHFVPGIRQAASPDRQGWNVKQGSGNKEGDPFQMSTMTESFCWSDRRARPLLLFHLEFWTEYLPYLGS